MSVIQLKHLSRLVVAATAALLVGPAGASASSNQDVFFEAPRDLTAASSTSEGRAKAFAEIQSLGVHAIRVNLR